MRQTSILSPLFLAGLFFATASCSDGNSSDEKSDQSSESPSAVKASQQPANSTRTESDSGNLPWALSAPPKLLPRAIIEAGWIRLFDGQTLFGWKKIGEADWKVLDGVLTSNGKAPGFLMTTFQLADYELRCDFRLQSGGNSGLFLRSETEPQNPQTDCYEWNLCDSHPAFPTGSIVAHQKAEATRAVEGEWNSLELTINGRQITANINDAPVTDFTDESNRPRRLGHIGLQSNGGQIEFKNIVLRPLGSQPIFNGTDLTGWREVPGSKSEFTAVNGHLHVTNGRGFLETEATWKDFVLQADCRTNGEHLNSGIFFRALPGTEAAPSHGYEYQIHNGFKNGDRADPIDHGTGAIFRRAKTRWVVADDNQWLSATLIANGPHFATWVDGIQVVDWTDPREPSENPRAGKKLAAGHLSLQGHDPTTDLDFRNLRVVTIPTSQ